MLTLASVFGISFVVSGANAVEEKLDAFKNVTAHEVKLQSTVYQGRPALKVELTDALQRQILNRQGANQPAFAVLPVDFQNGIIAGFLNRDRRISQEKKGRDSRSWQLPIARTPDSV